MQRFNYQEFGILLALMIVVFGISGVIFWLLKLDEKLPIYVLLVLMLIVALITLIIGHYYLKSKR